MRQLNISSSCYTIIYNLWVATIFCLARTHIRTLDFRPHAHRTYVCVLPKFQSHTHVCVLRVRFFKIRTLTQIWNHQFNIWIFVFNTDFMNDSLQHSKWWHFCFKSVNLSQFSHCNSDTILILTESRKSNNLNKRLIQKKPGQTAVLYQYCGLSRFFWIRR